MEGAAHAGNQDFRRKSYHAGIGDGSRFRKLSQAYGQVKQASKQAKEGRKEGRKEETAKLTRVDHCNTPMNTITQTKITRLEGIQLQDFHGSDRSRLFVETVHNDVFFQL